MDQNELKKYSDLVIEVGVNVYKEQCLIINCGILYYEFALMLADSAYARGAKYVDIQFFSNRLIKSRIQDNTDVTYLEFIPNYLLNKSYEILANDWAYIKIDNLEELDVLKGIDISKHSLITKSEQKTFQRQSQSFGISKNPWTVIAAPGPVWASKVFNSEASEKAVDELWKKLVPVLRLDKPNPSEEWRLQGERLIKRSETLSNMKLDKLFFEGPGTKLEIGLNKTSVWIGGPSKAANGRMFIPNLPTEEVFTTPDYRRTNGKVKVTKPVKVMENLLTGIWFEFKDGKAIDFGADSNKKVLEKYFSMDEGASYLGEVALVDSDSEIYKSGVIFNSILYDENAACHIALGRGIPVCLSNKDELNTIDDMKKHGCNYSLVHTDFMIGSEKVDITGVDENGNSIEIIKEGKFMI